jgi:hypothetical protein
MLPEGQLSRSTNTGLIGWGAFLIISGILCGGVWTYLINMAETTPGELFGTRDRWNGVPVATILTLVGTMAWVVGGALLVMRGSRSGSNLGQAGKNWGPTVILLIATAVCGYIFGFCACAHQVGLTN